MADSKTTALSAFTPITTDLLYGVDDPGGTPVSGKLTIDDLFTLLGKSTMAAGTLTDSAPFTLTQTWNDGSEAFTGMSVDITDTASASGSLLARLRAGGTTMFSVRKDGRIFGPTGADFDFQSATSRNFRFFRAGTLSVQIGAGGQISFGSSLNASLSWVEAANMRFDGAYGGSERSTDPSDPAEGAHAIWQSDGTGAGDDGDIMIKVTAGGATKTITLVDFSAF